MSFYYNAPCVVGVAVESPLTQYTRKQEWSLAGLTDLPLNLMRGGRQMQGDRVIQQFAKWCHILAMLLAQCDGRTTYVNPRQNLSQIDPMLLAHVVHWS